MSTKQTKSDDAAPAGGISGKVAAFSAYVEEAKAELQKVTWPTAKEVKVTSIAVLSLVVVMSIFLGLVDLGLTKLMEIILSAGTPS